MAICNIILRLDFNACFKFVNEHGTAMRLLLEYNKHFFPSVGDNVIGRQLIASRKTEDNMMFHSLSIQPTVLTAQIQSVSSLELDSAESNELFSNMCEFTTDICKTFDINILNRAGIRFIYLGKTRDNSSSKDALASFVGLIKDKYSDGLAQALGDIDDVGIVFTGNPKDKLNYRINAGPYFADKEAQLHAPEVADKLKLIKDYNYVCDVDFFELNFAAPSTSFIRWTKPAFVKLRYAVNAIENNITNIK